MQVESMRKFNSPTQQQSLSWRWLWPIISLMGFLLLWEAIVQLSGYPPYILPAPSAVMMKFQRVLFDGTLIRHTGITLFEIIGGLSLGVSLASILGYAIAKSPTLERVLTPYLVASQAIPVVAIAPLLIIWFGTGFTSKILISALIVFFPVLVNTIAGIRSVPDDLYDLMHSLQASPWQVFLKLELPAALPILFAGLKVGATLSVIGAVVGEFAGADAGLGFMINLADGLFDTARVFVGVFTLIGLALSLYGVVSMTERILLRWREQ